MSELSMPTAKTVDLEEEVASIITAHQKELLAKNALGQESVDEMFQRIFGASNSVNLMDGTAIHEDGATIEDVDIQSIRDAQEFCVAQYPETAALAIFDGFCELTAADTDQPISDINEFAELLEIGDRDARLIKNYLDRFVRYNNGDSVQYFENVHEREIQDVEKIADIGQISVDGATKQQEDSHVERDHKQLQSRANTLAVITSLAKLYESFYAHPSNGQHIAVK